MSKTTLGRIRKDGCAFVRDEIEAEPLSVAIPVFAPDGYVLTALEWSSATDADEATARRQHLPVLHRASLRIESMLTEVSLMASHATRA